MAQIRLHGRKALIIQSFNDLPSFVIMEFVNEDFRFKSGCWSTDTWVKRLIETNKKC